MADRFWIGGTGSWSQTAHWSATSGGEGGETVPTSSDDVFIDSNSGFDIGEVASNELNAGGQDWLVDDWFYVDGGDGECWGWVTEVDGNGAVVAYELDSYGSGYSVANNVPCVADGGAGTGLTINILSITGSGGTITLPNGVDADFHDITCSSGQTYTIDGLSNNNTINIYGSIVLESGLTFGSSSLYFLSDDDETITTAGVYVEADCEKDGVGKLTLLDNTQFRSFTLCGGTLDLNDFDLTMNPDGGSFTVDGVGLTLDLGSGILDIVDFACYPEDLTLIKGTSTIKIEGGEFTGAGYIYNNIWILLEGYIYDSNTFNDFKIDAGALVYFAYGTTTTVSSFTAVGEDGNLITLNDILSGGEILAFDVSSGGGGSGYAVGDIGSIDGFLGDSAFYEVTTVSGGVVTGVTFYQGSSGSGYSTGNNVSTTPYLGNGMGLLVDITSVSAILRGFTLSKSSGIVSCDYLDISNSNATGGANWYAGRHSTNGGNNDGWHFWGKNLATMGVG